MPELSCRLSVLGATKHRNGIGRTKIAQDSMLHAATFPQRPEALCTRAVFHSYGRQISVEKISNERHSSVMEIVAVSTQLRKRHWNHSYNQQHRTAIYTQQRCNNCAEIINYGNQKPFTEITLKTAEKSKRMATVVKLSA